MRLIQYITEEEEGGGGTPMGNIITENEYSEASECVNESLETEVIWE